MNSEISNISKVFAEKIAPKVREFSQKMKGEAFGPIGVFDSGVGGLSVLSEIFKELSSEDVIFLADTARVPYGGRPPQEIIRINIEILNYFEKSGAKAVVMACGTSSAIAFPVLKDKYPIPIISLTEPGAKAALAVTKNLKIGVIATIGTVKSDAYKATITSINKNAIVFSQACPLFVPLIEGGFIEAEETRKVAREYLKPLMAEGIDTLILGCTHYPHLAKIIQEIVGKSVTLVSPAEYAVAELKDILRDLKIANTQKSKGSCSYRTTGPTAPFEEIGSKLLGRMISGTAQIKL